MRSRAALFALLVAVPLAAWAAVPLVSSGESAKVARLQHRIDRAKKKIERGRSQEGVLTTDIQAASDRINRLQGDISVLTRRQDALQSNLEVKRAELNRIQESLRRERARLARLRARLVQSRAVLAVRLRLRYEVQPPDMVTVILNSRGFADLLERGEFMRRINRQDVQVITAVRVARAAAKRTSDRLAKLEQRQREITTAILARRNQVASVRLGLVDKRVAYAHARGAKAQTLRSVRRERKYLEEDVRAMQAQQAKIQGLLQSGSVGPIRRGSGRLIWPVNGPITSPYCERRAWEACHPGIDIGAPSGTSIRAADGGTVKIAGSMGGYGNYTCIQHTGALSTCYAHQSSIGVSVGQSVSQGQIIGLTGCTGLCFGPHLHFEVRVNGSVVNPLNYL